jgi:predicted protein tyrosine phosphatase
VSAKDDWPKQKNWKHMYTRSEKLKRSEQLGIAYPVVPGHKLVDRERVNVLFVCSRNQWRSPTAERMYKKHPVIVARSAGTSPNARHRISIGDVRWADVIMVMEDKHRERVVAEFSRQVEHTPIHVLDIPDEYAFMAPELIEVLEQTVEPLLFA